MWLRTPWHRTCVCVCVFLYCSLTLCVSLSTCKPQSRQQNKSNTSTTDERVGIVIMATGSGPISVAKRLAKSLQTIGPKATFFQFFMMRNIKQGTLVGEDRYGNKYFENLDYPNGNYSLHDSSSSQSVHTRRRCDAKGLTCRLCFLSLCCVQGNIDGWSTLATATFSTSMLVKCPQSGTFGCTT